MIFLSVLSSLHSSYSQLSLHFWLPWACSLLRTWWAKGSPQWQWSSGWFWQCSRPPGLEGDTNRVYRAPFPGNLGNPIHWWPRSHLQSRDSWRLRPSQLSCPLFCPDEPGSERTYSSRSLSTFVSLPFTLSYEGGTSDNEEISEDKAALYLGV